MRPLFVTAFLILFVATVAVARRPSCNRKVFWRQYYKKNNRVSWTDFESQIAGGSYLNIYTVNIGEPVATFRKAESRYSATADRNVHHLIRVYEAEQNGCVLYNVTYTTTDKKVCRHGCDTYIAMATTFETDGVTYTDGTTFYSQEPGAYILLFTCVEVAARGKCNRGFIFVQIRDMRATPDLGDEVDLSIVPWHKVAYDVYSLTRLKFGGPRVEYAWLGQDCRI